MSAYRVGPKSGVVIVEKAGEWTAGVAGMAGATGKGYRTTTSVSNLERRTDFQGYPLIGVGVKVSF